MLYFTSTRKNRKLNSAEAIAKGISDDGGLFVPSEFPQISAEQIADLSKKSYSVRASEILAELLTGFTGKEIASCVKKAYTGTFENNQPAPLAELEPGVNMLELWHGPTCAFKDMALQLLPHLLTVAAGKTAPGRTIVILVATSGDTGKAALEGFADVPGTKIIVFYPRDGVSAMQKLQMTSQAGNNVAVCGIEGNFDDAQTGVKAIFADSAMHRFLEERNMEFSSANSINFGRLAPQIVYYFSAYCDLVGNGRIENGEKINITVPTGNFGNILAAYYAKRMGLPVARFVCASNRNNILTDFLRTGVYDRNRSFYTTTSPSMDILISSNLERLLYHLYGDRPEPVAALMESLKKTGKYTVAPEVFEKLRSEFSGGFCDDAATAETIGSTFREHHYLCDTHTAVALNVYRQYGKETLDRTPCVIASTASPFKFAPAVLPAVFSGAVPEDGFARMEKLAEVTGTRIPAPLAALKSRAVLHGDTVPKDGMSGFIRGFLSRKG